MLWHWSIGNIKKAQRALALVIGELLSLRKFYPMLRFSPLEFILRYLFRFLFPLLKVVQKIMLFPCHFAHPKTTKINMFRKIIYILGY